MILISDYYCRLNDYEELLRCLGKDESLGAELAIFTDEHKPGFSGRLIDMKSRFAGRPVSFHGPHKDVEASASKDSPEGAKFINSFDKAFDICRAYGARYIVAHTNNRGFSEGMRGALQAQAGEAITLLYKLADLKEVTLLVENVGESGEGTELFREKEFVSFFEAIPGAAALFDVGHAYLNGWDMEYVMHELGSRIKACHLHNTDGISDNHFPFFAGKIDAEEVLRLIKRYTPGADLVLEYAPAENVTSALVLSDAKRIAGILKEKQQ